MAADKYSLLKRYWGYDKFRPKQEEIIDALIAGRDVLALLPTGGGKSLCYQLPALLREGVCLVVSPLIALMKDQVQQLNDRHLKAACIVSGMASKETLEVLYNAMAGSLKFLYVSPERLRQRLFIEHLRRAKLSLIAVDEAHCISQWGYDFRPPYLQIAEVRAYFPQVPMVALTATATPAVVSDIRAKLLMKGGLVCQSSFLRPNLFYRVEHESNKLVRLINLLKEAGGSSVVYVRSRRMTQSLALKIEASGLSASFYHAGLEVSERDGRQKAWMKGDAQVMVATNAFGMGIDKPDVRMVLHYDLPNSIEAYFQEAGRAGRDGKPATAVILYDDADIVKCEHDYQSDFPSLKYIRNVYKALCNYYRIPIGGGIEASYDFKMEDICDTYALDVRQFYAACGFLEREGLIAVPEREDLHSTLQILAQRDQVYRLVVDHMALGNLLDGITRMYTGLYMEATRIDEKRVASMMRMDVADVVALLKRLHAMRVVDYRPKPTMTQICFVSPRVAESGIMLVESGYDHLRQMARERMDAIIAYVKNDHVCRSRQLLSYFGEQSGADCGGCDVCCKKSHPVEPTDRAIARVLGSNRWYVAELVATLKSEGYEDSADVLRDMLDRGQLKIDENLMVYMVSAI